MVYLRAPERRAMARPALPTLHAPRSTLHAQRTMSDPGFRVGTGYDVHRLVPGRRLVLGGVTIPAERGLLGHSDADVVIHAAIDALLGAAALGDIGAHFPPSD